MRKASYFSLFILFSFLSQGNAIISKNSSDTHIRNKRVINHSPGGVQPAHPTLSRHLVQILVADTFECAGSILRPNIILTVRLCLYGSNDQYTVLSGSLTKYRGNHHRVLGIEKHRNLNLALLKINPPIILSPHGNQKIEIFTGSLPLNPAGLFSGWGCTDISPTGQRTYPQQLMATLLPIITYQHCYEASQAAPEANPLATNICTLDSRRQRGACYGDEGGSLVYGGRLVGIFSNMIGVHLGVYPDIYMHLSHEDIYPWIQMKVRELQRFHFRD